MPQVDHADGPEADGEPGPPAAEAPAGPSAAAAAARSSVSGMLTYINNSKLAGSAPLVYVPPAALATPGAAATAQAGAAPPAGQAASGVKWVQPSGPRRAGEGVENEEQGIISAEVTPSGGCILRVTLLAAGFIIGPSGSSVREVMKASGADIKSWTEQQQAPPTAAANGAATTAGQSSGGGGNRPAAGKGSSGRRACRVFVLEGPEASVVAAMDIMVAAVDRYKELCEGKYNGQAVPRAQRVANIEFSYQPPPKSIVPFAAALKGTHTPIGSLASSSSGHGAGGGSQQHANNASNSSRLAAALASSLMAGASAARRPLMTSAGELMPAAAGAAAAAAGRHRAAAAVAQRHIVGGGTGAAPAGGDGNRAGYLADIFATAAAHGTDSRVLLHAAHQHSMLTMLQHQQQQQGFHRFRQHMGGGGGADAMTAASLASASGYCALPPYDAVGCSSWYPDGSSLLGPAADFTGGNNRLLLDCYSHHHQALPPGYYSQPQAAHGGANGGADLSQLWASAGGSGAAGMAAALPHGHHQPPTMPSSMHAIYNSSSRQPHLPREGRTDDCAAAALLAAAAAASSGYGLPSGPAASTADPTPPAWASTVAHPDSLADWPPLVPAGSGAAKQQQQAEEDAAGENAGAAAFEAELHNSGYSHAAANAGRNADDNTGGNGNLRQASLLLEGQKAAAAQQQAYLRRPHWSHAAAGAAGADEEGRHSPPQLFLDSWSPGGGSNGNVLSSATASGTGRSPSWISGTDSSAPAVMMSAPGGGSSSGSTVSRMTAPLDAFHTPPDATAKVFHKQGAGSSSIGSFKVCASAASFAGSSAAAVAASGNGGGASAAAPASGGGSNYSASSYPRHATAAAVSPGSPLSRSMLTPRDPVVSPSVLRAASGGAGKQLRALTGSKGLAGLSNVATAADGGGRLLKAKSSSGSMEERARMLAAAGGTPTNVTAAAGYYDGSNSLMLRCNSDGTHQGRGSSAEADDDGGPDGLVGTARRNLMNQLFASLDLAADNNGTMPHI